MPTYAAMPTYAHLPKKLTGKLRRTYAGKRRNAVYANSAIDARIDAVNVAIVDVDFAPLACKAVRTNAFIVVELIRQFKTFATI